MLPTSRFYGTAVSKLAYFNSIKGKVVLSCNFHLVALFLGMTEPDLTDSKPQLSFKYFYKSKSLYRYSAFIFLWSIVYTQIIKPIGLNEIADAFLLAIPALSLYIITPLGLFYLIKSYLKKEPYNKYRAFYLLGHLFFLFILLALLFSMYFDYSKFLK